MALVALGAGIAAAAVGVSEMREGVSDYSKVQSGDFSKSYNFMRDTVCGGNETLYNVVKYGSVFISGAMIAMATGGTATKFWKDSIRCRRRCCIQCNSWLCW